MLVKQPPILYKSEKVGLVWVTDQVKSFVDFSVPFLSVHFFFLLYISGEYSAMLLFTKAKG